MRESLKIQPQKRRKFGKVKDTKLARNASSSRDSRLKLSLRPKRLESSSRNRLSIRKSEYQLDLIRESTPKIDTKCGGASGWPGCPSNYHLGSMMKKQVRIEGYIPPKSDYYHNFISYEVESPHRVSLRLEKLMGHTTAYLNDYNYYRQLHYAIRQEEERIYKQICKVRQTNEEDRVKDLVLQGLMEPPEGLESLKSTIIYRVNKVIEKLQTMRPPSALLPYRTHKISPVEPFAHDSSGKFFVKLHEEQQLRSLANRKKSRLGSLGKIKLPVVNAGDVMKEGRHEVRTKGKHKIAASDDKPYMDFGTEIDAMTDFDTHNLSLSNRDGEEPHVEDDEMGAASNSNVAKVMGSAFSDIPDAFRQMLDKELGKMPNLNNLEQYRNFQDHFIHDYLDTEDSGSLFQHAQEIYESYERENMVADEFLTKLGPLLSKQQQ